MLSIDRVRSWSIIFCLIFSSAGLNECWAQSGTIQYSHTSPILRLPSENIRSWAREQVGLDRSDQLTHQSLTTVLSFNNESTLMYPINSRWDYDDEGSRQGALYVDTTYVDLAARRFTQSRELFWNTYIVEDTLKPIMWQISTKERLFMDYRIQQATAVSDSVNLEAWFSPEIPLPIGPGLYSGLPGAILVVADKVTGEVYTATSIELGAREMHRAPVIGKVVSLNSFDNIRTFEFERDRQVTEEIIQILSTGTVTRVGSQ